MADQDIDRVSLSLSSTWNSLDNDTRRRHVGNGFNIFIRNPSIHPSISLACDDKSGYHVVYKFNEKWRMN